MFGSYQECEFSRPRFFVEEIRQRLTEMEAVLRRFEMERRGTVS